MFVQIKSGNSTNSQQNYLIIAKAVTHSVCLIHIAVNMFFIHIPLHLIWNRFERDPWECKHYKAMSMFERVCDRLEKECGKQEGYIYTQRERNWKGWKGERKETNVPHRYIYKLISYGVFCCFRWFFSATIHRINRTYDYSDMLSFFCILLAHLAAVCSDDTKWKNCVVSMLLLIFLLLSEKKFAPFSHFFILHHIYTVSMFFVYIKREIDEERKKWKKDVSHFFSAFVCFSLKRIKYASNV